VAQNLENGRRRWVGGWSTLMAREMIGQKQRDEDEEEAPKPKKQRSELVRIVIPGAIAIFVAILGAQVAAPIVTQMIVGQPGAAVAESDEEAAQEEEELAAEEEEEAESTEVDPAIYTPLDPPLVVSFAEEEGGTRFLQLTLQAMARSEHAIEGIKQHQPAIRNAFLFLLSARHVDELMTLEGKEKLRAEMTAKAQEILEINTGEPAIEELYFTSFVIQ
jgi:flagellar protein FliL